MGMHLVIKDLETSWLPAPDVLQLYPFACPGVHMSSCICHAHRVTTCSCSATKSVQATITQSSSAAATSSYSKCRCNRGKAGNPWQCSRLRHMPWQWQLPHPSQEVVYPAALLGAGLPAVKQSCPAPCLRESPWRPADHSMSCIRFSYILSRA